MRDLSDAATERLAGEREAEAVLLSMRSWPTCGDELLACLTRATSRGQIERLRGFCRRLQQKLLTGQKEWPREAAKKSKGAKWMVSRKPAAS